MWLKFSRAMREGMQYFSRNRLLSVATISVMTLSLFVVGVVFLLGAVFSSAAQTAREQISISVYFNPDVSQEQIEDIKTDITKYREVEKVSFVSKEDALDEFVKTQQDDANIIEALDEIGDNPFFDSLVVVAYNPQDYELIASQIDKSYFRDLVSDVNYARNKEIIDRLAQFSNVTRNAGFLLGPLLVLISLLITYTTIKITLYASREEFEVKRLVGASNLYVRFPAVIQGLLYGVISAVLASLMLLGAVLYVTIFAHDVGLLPTPIIKTMMVEYGWAFVVGLLYIGVILGVGSSYFAISRYLKK